MKNTVSIAFIFIYFWPLSPLLAQYENAIWFFGTGNAGMRFNMATFDPQAYTVHSPLNVEGGCVVVHPSTGQLLFYTDGNTVFNRNHEPMPNGVGLGACSSSAQAAVIAPVPEDFGLYYIFSNTVGGCGFEPDLKFRIVDMKMENGLGDVYPESVNNVIQDSVNEGMIIIPESGTPNFWLVGASASTQYTHYVLHITNNGINLHSTFTGNNFGYSYNFVVDNSKTKIAVNYPSSGVVQILNFDPITGVLCCPQVIEDNLPDVYDAEFSPGGTKLYYSTWKDVTIMQYDFLESGDPIVLFSSSATFGGGLRAGPDGRIYHISNGDSTTLAVINKPDEPGLACDYQLAALELHNPIDGLNFSEIAPAPAVSSGNAISGVINDYAAVVSFCHNIFQVENASAFSPGDKVLIIQMQGAKIQISDTEEFGDILDYEDAGNYELNEIRSVEGNEIHLKYKLRRSYSEAGRVQMVSVPNLGNAVVGNLTALPWNGKTGGVLAFIGEDIVMQGNINVSGRGFRGGQVMNMQTTGCESLGYYYNTTQIEFSGLKGEGIAILTDQYNRGKGEVANGGGGGNNHNAGGGGGGNFGHGGLGGYWIRCIEDPSGTQGLAGNSISYSIDHQKVFMGGGGGAGHSNNNEGYSGGDGGGIALLWVNTLRADSFLIMANGESIGNGPDFIDGAGGGGGGGAVLLHFNEDNPYPVQVQVNGGKGGGTHYVHGYGGGGGAGLLWVNAYPSGGIHLAAFGGQSGIGEDGSSNGATDGENGNILAGLHIPRSLEDIKPLRIDSIILIAECDGTGAIQINATGGDGILQYSLNGEDWSTSPTFPNLQSGSYQAYLADDCELLESSVELQAYPILQSELIYQQHVICDSLGKVEFFPIGGKPPIQFKLNHNEILQDDGLFEQLDQGSYQLTAIDDRGCTHLYDFMVEDGSYEISIDLPLDPVIVKGDTIELPISMSPSHPSHLFEWLPQKDMSCWDCPSPHFFPLITREYSIRATDHFGCKGEGNTHIHVKDYSAYIPNAISINDDGTNDYFFIMAPPGKIERVVSLKVFDRWGGLVFSVADMPANNEEAGWDGHINGKKAPTGVYTYVAEIEFFDEEVVVKKGTLHLFH